MDKTKYKGFNAKVESYLSAPGLASEVLFPHINKPLKIHVPYFTKSLARKEIHQTTSLLKYGND